MLETMKNRRTIRRYTEQAIPETLLNELLEVAARASNTGNMQLYSVVVTRDKAMKERLAPAHFNQPMITTAPGRPDLLRRCQPLREVGGTTQGGRRVRQFPDLYRFDHRCHAVCAELLYGCGRKRIGNLLFGDDGL